MTTQSNDDVLDGVLVVEDDDRGAYGDLELPPPQTQARRRGWSLRRVLLVGLVAVTVLVALGLWTGDPRTAFVTRAVAWVGSLDFGGSAAVEGLDVSGLLTHEVQAIDLRITAMENGTLESASSVNVLCDVEGNVAIIELVPEGTVVEAGDVVVELESSGLRTRRTEQQIVVEKARAAHSRARQDNLVAESQADSDIKTAELGLEFAKLDLQKYIEGDYPLQLRALQTETALAEEELERARVALQFSSELHADGYLSEGELAADRFAETQTRFRVEMSKERERLLHEYTFPRMQRDLSSKVSEAERALDRVKSLAAASVDQARTNLASLESTLRLEETKLTHLEDQLNKCIMRAPQAGVVVYPVPVDEDLVELYIKQGAIVRERQHVFSIPNTDALRVSTNIHEALVNQVRPGMQARLWVDVYPDEELRGEVTFVSPLPLPEDWRKSTVKFYETYVKVTTSGTGELRPGMSAKVEILIDQQRDTLVVPVQSVVQRGSTGYCYVVEVGSPVLRKLTLGKANSKYIAVSEGLAAGERVVLSPDVIGFPGDLLHVEDQSSWGDDATVLADTSALAPEVVFDELEFEGTLLAPAGPAIAQAEYEVQSQEGTIVDREFEITVQDGTPDATWDITVAGVRVGEIVLDAAGAGKMSLSMQDGTLLFDFPLDIKVGTIVTVGDELTGELR